jgi:organic radical activating enzyme
LNKWQAESEQLDQGVQLPDCEPCWRDEDRGLLSYRLKNVSTPKNNIIEIFMSNLCNQMCSYCSPKYSSVWQDSIAEQGSFTGVSATANLNLAIPIKKVDHSEYWLSQIHDYVNTCEDNTVSIKLLGGEPLMQVKTLEKLLSFNKNKIQEIAITTNLNPPNNKFLYWLLDNIPNKKLLFLVSLDGTPDYNHIPRAGFDRNKFLENFDLLIQHRINFNFKSVVSILNMFDLENFIPWVSKKNLTVIYNKINNPTCLSPEYLPKEFRLKIWQRIQHLEVPILIRELLEHPADVVDLKLFEQYNYLNQYFTRSGTDPFATNNALFIEYWTWLTKKYK